MSNLITIKDASIWASSTLGKNVTPSNITYLVQYGRIPRMGNSSNLLIDRRDLEIIYDAYYKTKSEYWKAQLGDDLNWDLSFADYKEAETTKHVHRLHPYKGKFIPQLVEYFLDQHTDHFKQRVFFKPNDIVLDPFCGSGTTLVQSNELNLHAIGIDVSAFNAFISNSKLAEYDSVDIYKAASLIAKGLIALQETNKVALFEKELLQTLSHFNAQFFPSPDFKYQVRHKQIDEKNYGEEKAEQILSTYHQLIRKHDIPLLQAGTESFLETWFLQTVRNQIDFVLKQIKAIKNPKTKKILALILSRTIRSCRATTHADLGTLKEPVTTTYYCKKHGKICKPLFSIKNWWQRYSEDSIKRIKQFSALRSDTFQTCLVGDSRNIDLQKILEEKNIKLARLLKNQKIAGIFSSPPYVGLINYHEQHAYAYDLFGFDRNDELEIGPLYKGQGIVARQSYIEGVSEVLRNTKHLLAEDYHVFLVANDKYGLYPKIADSAGMKIVNQYKRPVLNRVEKDRSTYAEIIFHMQEK